jgi:hypothetical protein
VNPTRVHFIRPSEQKLNESDKICADVVENQTIFIFFNCGASAKKEKSLQVAPINRRKNPL